PRLWARRRSPSSATSLIIASIRSMVNQTVNAVKPSIGNLAATSSNEKQEHNMPINPDWVDMEASASVTEAFHNLLPKGIPYQTYIIVERNLDTLYGGTCVDANEKRLRYFVISVIPDTEFPFDCSYPLIHTMWMVSLHCWELIRAALGACTKEMQVLLAKNPVPPILNNARLEWVSLYLGREPYKGICKLSEQWVEAEDFDGIDADIHLYKVREKDDDPLLQKLIAAYDADYPIAQREEAGTDALTEV
ncbi:MAG: hypothetical protein IIY43_10495, partial [Oscillospiraceae bacterium]|nr:hypothetical protein [Oscillospiraceae bacterium]